MVQFHFLLPLHLLSPHSMLSFVLKIFNLTSSRHITTGDVAAEFHCGSLETKSSFHLIADQTLHFRIMLNVIFTFILVYFMTLTANRVISSGSLSKEQSAFSGCKVNTASLSGG